MSISTEILIVFKVRSPQREGGPLSALLVGQTMPGVSPGVVFLFFFLPHHEACGIHDQGSKLCPQQWKHRVLATGPPGKSPAFFNGQEKPAPSLCPTVRTSGALNIQRSKPPAWELPPLKIKIRPQFIKSTRELNSLSRSSQTRHIGMAAWSVT